MLKYSHIRSYRLGTGD